LWSFYKYNEQWITINYCSKVVFVAITESAELVYFNISNIIEHSTIPYIYIGVLYCGYALSAFFLSLSLFITIYITIGTYYLYNNTYICIYPVSLIVAYTYTLHMYTRMRVRHLYCVTIHTSQLIRPELIKNILKVIKYRY